MKEVDEEKDDELGSAYCDSFKLKGTLQYSNQAYCFTVQKQSQASYILSQSVYRFVKASPSSSYTWPSSANSLKNLQNMFRKAREEFLYSVIRDELNKGIITTYLRVSTAPSQQLPSCLQRGLHQAPEHHLWDAILPLHAALGWDNSHMVYQLGHRVDNRPPRPLLER